MRWLACVCTGVWNGVTISVERECISHLAEERPETDLSSSPLALSLSLLRITLLTPVGPRAVSPDIMVHTRIRGITRLPPSPCEALPPAPPSSAPLSPHRPAPSPQL